MTVQEILNFDIADISKMTKKDLAHTVSILSSASNKRIKRFNTKGLETPATKGAKRSGGNFSVKGKNVNELRSEFVRAKTFLNAKTSTSKGYKKVIKEFEERVGGKMSISQTKTFWEAYNKLVETNPHQLQEYGSDKVQRMLRDEMVDNNITDPDDLVKYGMSKLDSMYESIEEEYNRKVEGYEGSSDFFKLGEDL